MTIKERIEDAAYLWENNRPQGAFLCALVAVAATARKRYPKASDRDAFIKFLEDCHAVRLELEYQGSLHSVEEILYKFIRCEIVHEGGMPPDIKFMADSEPNQMTARAGGAPEYVLKIGTGWFFHMINAVKYAQENSNLFSMK